MESTRGCPYSCTYCHVIFGKKTRYRTPESVIDEIKTLIKDQNITDLFFTDDIFNIDKKRATRIFDLIIAEKIKVRIHFPNGLRGDIMDEEFIDKMVEAGVISVAYAFETPSPRIQKYMKKNVHLEKLKKVVHYTCTKGIMVRLFFMYGFPTETEEDVNYTLEFMKQFKYVVSPYFFALKYYRDTEMYEQAQEQGFNISTLDNSAKGLYTEFEFCETPLLSKEFMKKVHYRWLSEIILNKERFTNALEIQKKFHTDEEIIAYYSSFFGKDFDSIESLLKLCKTTDNEPAPDEIIGQKLTGNTIDRPEINN
jgi:MoaA/NifB/PqqE/SkfB family radical SAM enzyme